jgi:hypothetical protein
MIEVSLDGGTTFIAAPSGVRVVVKEVAVPGEDGLGELHLNLTAEGVVSDVWVTREEPLDHNIGTSSETFDEMIESMVEQAA